MLLNASINVFRFTNVNTFIVDGMSRVRLEDVDAWTGQFLPVDNLLTADLGE